MLGKTFLTQVNAVCKGVGDGGAVLEGKEESSSLNKQIKTNYKA